MPKTRKRRGLHGNGLKLDGVTLSLDLCPHCYAFGCDPFAMSPAFRRKIDRRRRLGLCPACGKPKAYCSCKSSLNATTSHTIRTHNNKKLRKAKANIVAVEKAARLWADMEGELLPVLGTSLYGDIGYSFRYHQTPPIPFRDFEELMAFSGLDMGVFKPAWG